jgi:hypothetical protein
MIDPATESLMSLDAAREAVPCRPAASTVWRWAREGVRGVTLETVRVGGRRFTSAEAVRRFIDRLNAEPHEADLREVGAAR